MKTPKLTLISHHLCPYVQRAAIALSERGVAFERRNIDLANKPDWFLKLSPLGKVPVLVIDDDTVLFESSVIAQYVDEITGNTLVSPDVRVKYSQLAWMEIASRTIAEIGNLYNAGTPAAAADARANIEDKFQRLEAALGDGPWFSGEQFTLVDAAFAPAFRYFDTIDSLVDYDVFAATPAVSRWRKALSERPSVLGAVDTDYPDRLLDFLAARDSYIGHAARDRIADRDAAWLIA